MSNEVTPLVFGDSDYEHEVGNPNCGHGWCGGTSYPKKCECGGLIHANFGDEDMDCNYWLYTMCDKCGESE